MRTTAKESLAVRRALIEPIAEAVNDDGIAGVADALVRLTATDAFQLPNLFGEPRTDRYTRKLIHADPTGRFVIIGMTWAKGQSSPLHDHAGLWGAEIVVEGIMRETWFELAEIDAAERYRFIRGATRLSSPGSVATLVPPHEYHDFGNGGDSIAHSIHVYGGNPISCKAFSPATDGWWSAREVTLSYSA